MTPGSARDVRLKGVEKQYGPVQALHPLDLDVRPGELLVLLGPSGCGKSTLLRLIAGLEEPTGGEVWIGGERVDQRSPGERDVAMVFQSYALYPHMTVRRNLGFGLKVRGVPAARVEVRVGEVAALLGLGALLDRRPGQLSGGQRQRVALGRAMVREPGVFLFDEPLSNLDARLRLNTRNEIAALHRRLGTTMVFVTHDQVEAMSLGQRIAVLDAGRLQQIGTPEAVYDRPANLFVAGFVGTPPINRVAVSPERGALRAGDLAWTPSSVRAPAVATLAVRPEDLELGEAGTLADGADLTAVVERVESLGSERLVHFPGPAGEPWVLRCGPGRRVARGDRVPVCIHRERAHLFDGAGDRWGSLAEALGPVGGAP